MSALIRVAVIY